MKTYPINRIRMEHLLPYIKGREVLDIGSTGNILDDYVPLFGLIRNHAKIIIGIDIDEKAIKHRNMQGYNIIKGNAEDFKIFRKFDVITAYEVVEHLSNIGRFLDNANNHLKQEGTLIIETDNAYRMRDMLIVLFTGKFNSCKEHTAIFTEEHITEILRRAGFVPIKFIYYGLPCHKPGSFAGNVIVFFSYLLGLLRKKMRATVLCVAKKR